MVESEEKENSPDGVEEDSFAARPRLVLLASLTCPFYPLYRNMFVLSPSELSEKKQSTEYESSSPNGRTETVWRRIYSFCRDVPIGFVYEHIKRGDGKKRYLLMSLVALFLLRRSGASSALVYIRNLVRGASKSSDKEVTLSLATQWIENGWIERVDFLLAGTSDASNFAPTFIRLIRKNDHQNVYITRIFPSSVDYLLRLVQSKVPIYGVKSPAGASFGVLQTLLPLAAIIFYWRLTRGLLNILTKLTEEPTGDLFDFRRLSPDVEASSPRIDVTFDDVITTATSELRDVVDYLNHPQKYQQKGARLPRGILLVGPSGTGKTLLARAVAGEAQVPFCAVSAAEFVEVYVGRGAQKVRTLFRKAKQEAPCVIFIDELDAIGRRPSGSTRPNRDEGKEEYIQTVNQLLTELDGFESGRSDISGVVVIAATNRLGSIDPSLLRAGRFDRWVNLSLPTEEERLEILHVHIRRKHLHLSPGAYRHMPFVVRQLKDATGADLESFLNEVVLMQVCGENRQNSVLEEEDFDKAVDKWRMRSRFIETNDEAEIPSPFMLSPLLHLLSSSAAAPVSTSM